MIKEESKLQTSNEGMLDYDCPECGKELRGSFGDNVSCGECQKIWETDWEYVGDNIACRITGEIKIGDSLQTQLENQANPYRTLERDEVKEYILKLMDEVNKDEQE